MTGIDPVQIHELKKSVLMLRHNLDSTGTKEARTLAAKIHSDLQTIFPEQRNLNKMPVKFDSGILVDDDSIFASIWNAVGKRFGKHVVHYPSAKALLAKIDSIPKNTFIYVDYFLPEPKDCESLVAKLVELGFKNVFVTTNAFDVVLPAFPGVPVIPKNAPWGQL